MTKEQHIKYWDNQVDEDFDCAEVLYKANHFAQSLFWAHLSLEKLCKSVWIKENESNTVPYIHNLLRLVTMTNLEFTEDDLSFFSEMNTFQIKGRYPEYAVDLEETITKEMILCLRKKMQ